VAPLILPALKIDANPDHCMALKNQKRHRREYKRIKVY